MPNVREKLNALRGITKDQQEYGTRKLYDLGLFYDDGTIEGVNDTIPKTVARIDDDIVSSEYAWSSYKINNELAAGASALSAEVTARTQADAAEVTARNTAITEAVAAEAAARDAAINSAVASIWKVVGRVNTVADLPATGNKVNDVYLVGAVDAAEFAEYYWTGTRWEYLGTIQTVDLSGYYTKTEVDALLSGKQATLTFDNTPTANSNNPVKSGGIKSAIDAVATPIATTSTAGKVKPDGTTITVDNDGTIHSSGDSSDIQVFKSTDFEPITHTYGGVTYRYPRVTFNGTNNGKILGIRYVDSNGKNRSLIGSTGTLNIKHFGANLFFSWGANKSSTNYGVTTTHLGKGKYQIQGTATWSGSSTSTKIQIGTLPGTSYTAPVTPIGSDVGTVLKIFNLQGEYNGLKIAIGTESYDNACRLDEVKSIPKTTSVTNVYLYLVKGETYDCTFDLQITATNDMGSTDIYEAPFAMMTSTTPFTPFANARSYPGSFKVYSYQLSSSTTNYYVEGAGNTSGFGMIDYPLVHCGKNTIVAGDYHDCSDETLPTFEVYYSEDFRITTKDKLAEVEYSIVDGHFSKAGYITGSFTASNTPGLKYLKINNVTWANPDGYTIPNGVWVSYSKTANQNHRNGHGYGMFSTDDYNQFVNRTEGGSGASRSLYVPKSEFLFHTDGYLWVPIPDSLTNGSTYYYGALPDWEGFDDSVN